MCVNEKTISHDTAKLALLKGITWRSAGIKLFGFTSKFYSSKGTLVPYGRTGRLNIDKAPYAFTQSSLRKYLREEKNIDIEVCIVTKGIKNMVQGYTSKVIFNRFLMPLPNITISKTYEESLEEGLKHALETLKITNYEK